MCFPLCTFGKGQWKNQLDSLLNVLRDNKHGDAPPELLFLIGEQYKGENPDSATRYYNAGNVAADKTNDLKGRFRYLALMTELYANQAKFEKALEYCYKMLALSEQFHTKHYLAPIYNNMGATYSDMGKPEKALEYYQKAVILYEHETPVDSKHLAYGYGNLLGIYVALEQKDKAYEYGQKALKFSKATNDDVAIAVTLANLSSVMLKMGKFDSALFLAKQEYEIGEKINNKRFLINSLCNSNSVYVRLERYDSLLHSAEEIEKYAVATNDSEGIASADFYKALYYFNSGNYKKSNVNSIKALSVVENNGIHTILERDIHTLLSQTSLVLGDTKNYHLHFRISDSLQESYTSDKALKYNQQLQVEYDVDKKLAEIKLLNSSKEIQDLKIKQQKITNIVLVSILSGLIVLAMLVYGYYNQKTKLLEAEDTIKKRRILELEKEKELLAIESIMQGHEEERKRMATDLHDGVGSILSATKYAFSAAKERVAFTTESATAFDNSMEMLDKSIQELRQVAHNMMPEALLKFGLDTALKDFCYTLNQNGKTLFTYQSFNLTDNTIAKNIATQVYRIVQELANNILKHAESNNALIQIVFS